MWNENQRTPLQAVLERRGTMERREAWQVARERTRSSAVALVLRATCGQGTDGVSHN